MTSSAWMTVAEVQQRMHEQLDREWDIEELAKVAGYDDFHFAHVFTDVVGEPPLRYLRRLRLERAAHDLVADPESSVAAAARRAGYASLEAFSRSFRRAFGCSPRSFRIAPKSRAGVSPKVPEWKAHVDPATFPEGLATKPELLAIGPLCGWTVDAPSFDDLEEVGRAMMPLLELVPPDGPWQLGGIAQPWGWAAETRRDLRVFRLVDDTRLPPPPIRPWRLPRGWFARFDYDGLPTGIATACAWIMSAWIPQSGLRVAFAPLFTLLEGSFSFDRSVARIHAPIESMTPAR